MLSIPGPGRVVTTTGSLAHKVLSGGLSVAQSLVDRLPGAPGGAPDAGAIGSNPERRYGSAGSRSLTR